MKQLSLILMGAFIIAQACQSPESRVDEDSDSTIAAAKGKSQDDNTGTELTGSGQSPSGDFTHKTSADDDSALFLEEAGVGGLLEVTLANVALKQASDARVKVFAQHMVTDHGKTNQEVAKLAKDAGILIPNDFIPEKDAVIAKLKKLSGAAFDKQYMDLMVDSHTKAITLYKRGQNINKKDFVEFAKKTLPVLENHLNSAKEIRSSLK